MYQNNIDIIDNIGKIININYTSWKGGSTSRRCKSNVKEAYITALELSELLGISVSRAYRLIDDMNKELANEGYLTVLGRVPTRYLEERWYSGNEIKNLD